MSSNNFNVKSLSSAKKGQNLNFFVHVRFQTNFLDIVKKRLCKLEEKFGWLQFLRKHFPGHDVDCHLLGEGKQLPSVW